MITSDQFDALVIAAKSGKALVGYVIVVLVWAYLSYRTTRNKNLLDKIRHFPPEQRVEVFRRETGMPELKGSLSPEQWLRSRIHAYYFLAFLAFLILIAVLFSIYADLPGSTDDDTVAVEVEPTYVSIPQNRNPDLLHPEIGWSKAAALAQFGPPHYYGNRNRNHVYYRFKDYYLYIIFKDDIVAATSIIARSINFKPKIEYPEPLKCLGCFTLFSGNAVPHFANFGTYFTYVERTGTGSVAEGRVARYYIYSSGGAEFSKSGVCYVPYYDMVILRSLIEVDRSKDKKAEDWQEAKEFARMRKNCKPNGIAWVDSFREERLEELWPEFGQFPS